MKEQVLLFVLGCTSLGIAQANPPAVPGTAAATRYTVMLAGSKQGFETSSQAADGSLQLYWEFNDRGRGPKINERIVLDKNGVPTELQNEGVDYLKAPVTETFTFKQGLASWKNRAEQGEKKTAPAFYVSLSGVPEESAILARALLAAGGTLPLLPAGEASIEKRGSLKVEAKGQSMTVVQYAVTGLDFVPDPIWLDQDGNFFAFVTGGIGFVVIREGWESAVDTLSRAQDEIDNSRAANLASTLAHIPSGPLVFLHANVFDAETATVQWNRTVLIRGERIIAVGEDGTITPPPGAEVVDAAGKMLVPGLWDMHVHLAPNDGLLLMASGVTSVRDLGNDSDHLLPMRGRFDAGTEIGPRVLLAALIDGRGPYAGPTKVYADTEEEARENIDKYAKLGYVQVKIYSSIKPELVPKIVVMAHLHGMRVSGHVPAFMTAQQFVEDGVDEIQHMNFIFLNFMFDKVKDTRTPARFTEVAAHGAEIDPSSPQVKDFIKLLQDHKTVLDPTLNVFEAMFTDRAGTVSALYAAVADRMPAQIRRGFLYGGLEVPAGMDQRYQDSFRQMLKMTKAFYNAGIPIVAGTDALAGFTLPRELELYEQAGIPSAKVLQLATLGAAHVMKRDQDLGSIAPGKLADMILVEGDPTVHVGDVRNVRTVVKGGVIYQSADLYRAVGVKPQ